MSVASNTRMDDGFSTLITLENIPSVKMWEKEVTPPGITSGGPIDTTTMRSTAWRTSSPRKLKSLTAVAATVAFATAAVPDIMAQVGVLQRITLSFPDGATLMFWGWLEEFKPGNFKEGDQPTASISVQPSNHDSAGAEAAPVYTEGSEESAILLDTGLFSGDGGLFSGDGGLFTSE
jgi:hypothetical protein